MTTIKNKSDTYAKSLLIPLTFIFPLLFSMGVCSEVGTLRAAFSAVVLSLFIDKFDCKALMPTLFSFLVVSFVSSVYGSFAVIISLSVAGLVLCLGYQINKKAEKIKDSPVIIGIMLGTAIAITVLQTTNYFGIGATGNTVREMISSYVSLGFHGNWRGVLYGTIVMVVMITFPRKFKSLSNTVSPMFIALLLTLILNFCLNPSDMITAINEAGEFNYNNDTNLSLVGAIISILFGVVIGLSNIYSVSQEECSKKDYIITGFLNIALSPLYCFIPKKFSGSITKNIPGAIILAAFLFIFKDILIRIPVHSCAVILIVSAWENVRWRKVKHAFNSLGSVILFLIPIIFIILI